jgi:hypothetical protein
MQDVFEEQGQQPAHQGETQPEQQPQEQSAQPPEGEGAAPPAADTTRHVPLEALEAERKGRQDWKEKAIRAEAERDQLRQQMERGQQPPQQQQQDPLLTLQQQMVNDRFNFSEALMREKHADVDEAVEAFKEAAKQNPALVAQMHANPLPWKFAYEEGKRLRFATEIGNDPEAYRKKVRAEIEAELKAQQQPASLQSQQPAAQPLPQSLAGARSSGARGGTFTGPVPFETLFPN